MDKCKATTLLFGMPRSGTTWIGKIFDSHPSTLYRHEPDSQSPISIIPLFPNHSDALQHSKNSSELNEFISSMPYVHDSKVCAKLPFFKKVYLNYLQNTFLKGSIYATKLSFLPILQKQLIYSPDYHRKINRIHLVWKSIESLGRLEFILRKHSNFKGIHIIRHPCGYIASVLNGEKKQQFTTLQPSSEDYGIFEFLLKSESAKQYNLTLEDLKKLEPIERLAWRWVLYNENTLTSCINLDNYTFIYYDNLCKNTLSESKRLFEFSKLTWNRQSEIFVRSSISSKNKGNSSYYSIYKDPEQASNKWKTQLSEEKIQKIMNIVNKSILTKYIDF